MSNMKSESGKFSWLVGFPKITKPLIVGGSIVLAMILAGTIFLQQVSNATSLSYKRMLREVSIHTAMRINDQIENSYQSLQILARLQADKQNDALFTIAADIIDNDQFLFVCSVEKNGQHSVIETAIPSTDISFADIPTYLQTALAGENATSNAISIPQLGGDVLISAVPVFETNGTVQRAIVGIKMASSLKSALSVALWGGDGYTYIIRSTGQAVFAPYRDDVRIDFSSSLSFDESKSFQSLPGLSTLPETLARGEIAIFSYQLRGESKYLSCIPIEINDWYLLTIISHAHLGANTDSLQSWIWGLGITFIVGLVGFMLYIFYSNKKARSKIIDLASTDPLTGLLNNAGLEQYDSVLADAKEQDVHAVVVFDINKFKLINDKHGFRIGDQILQSTSHLLNDVINHSKNEAAARLSADEFALLLVLDSPISDSLIVSRLEVIFSRINKETLPALNLNLGFACGVCRITAGERLDWATGGGIIGTAVGRANIARKSSKQFFGTKICFYNTEMKRELEQEQMIESRMHQALKNGEFKVFLQAQYDLNKDAISGAEALVRWQTPDQGILPPDSFIPVFEKNGFLSQVDYYVFEEVCKLMKEWADADYIPIRIAVNMSRLHIYEPDFVTKLQSIAQKYNVPSSMIELELTETVMMEELDAVLGIMKDLHDAGFKLSMDDFGSGYSSLNLLTELPVDVLKLDRGFLKSFESSARGQEIICAIVTLAHQLDLEVVAEGVETVEQVAFLKGIQCDIAQGYYYAKPLPCRENQQILRFIKGKGGR